MVMLKDYLTPELVVDEFNRRFSMNDWISLLMKLGWKPYNINSSFPTFTRNGKDRGASGELLKKGNVILFHNFSDNSNFPVKPSGKNTFSPVEAITHFCFKGDWKKAYMYFSEYINVSGTRRKDWGNQLNNNNNIKQPNPRNRKIVLTGVESNLIYNEAKKRLYRLSINRSVRNKNLDPVTMSSHSDYMALTTGFVCMSLTDEELADNIGKGFSICCSILRADNEGNTYRNSEKWNGSELIGIDIDNGLTIEDCLKKEMTKYALLLYTTPSHTKENHRFRLIFRLPYFEEDKDRYKMLIDRHVEHYKSDSKAASVVTAFYGNSEADIYLIQSKKILKYRNGRLVETINVNGGEKINTLPKPDETEYQQDKLVANWCEVHYRNDQKRYVPTGDAEALYSYYRKAGKYIQDIRPLYYDESTNCMTFLNEKTWKVAS